MRGTVLQLGLEAYALGDIAAVEDQAALVAVDRGLHMQPAAPPRADPALDPGDGLLGGMGGQKPAHLVQHPAQVLGVDVRGELGADQVLGLPPVHALRGGAHVAQDSGRRGDHDDVAGSLHEGAEVVLLLGQLLGEGDVVQQHDALADDEREHDGAAGEQHHLVDLPAVDGVVEDAQDAHRGREVRGEGAERAGDLAARLRLDRAAAGSLGFAAAHPGGVRQEHAAGEPAGVEDLARLVVLAQQR